MPRCMEGKMQKHEPASETYGKLIHLEVDVIILQYFKNEPQAAETIVNLNLIVTNDHNRNEVVLEVVVVPVLYCQ